MPSSSQPELLTSIETAKLLGMAVRSVQLMVDRGELVAWKTPGGHRRISRESIDRFLMSRGKGAAKAPAPGASSTVAFRQPAALPSSEGTGGILLIEDSLHFQNLIRLLVGQLYPELPLHVAGDGIVGLAMVGQWKPRVLIVDILLPGIDGATLITSLRSQPQFSETRLIVVTSLDAEDRDGYGFALAGLPVVHKPRLVAELPPLLAQALSTQDAGLA